MELLFLLFRDQQIRQQLGFVSNSVRSRDRSAAETIFEINMHLLWRPLGDALAQDRIIDSSHWTQF